MECEIVRAQSGNEALRQLLKREFALMLLDVQMPGMDGYEVARYARENPSTRDVPIIFLTAMNAGDDTMLRGYETGAVDFLWKPVNHHVLRSKVQVFLELYQNRRKLAALLEELEQKNKELESFSYSVAHDLRAPLRAIDGFSNALLADCAERLDEQGRHYLDRVRAGANRMAALIDDLLNLSRVGRAPLRRETVNLSAIAETVIAELRRREPTRKVSVEILKEIPALADPRLMAVVLENLLGNAWKFTQKKSTAHVSFSVVRRGEETVYEVRDDGAGFDMAHAARLFGAFQRLHGESEFEGTGIGLATVQRIIARHGGRIWAEAETDKGAAFFFTLGEK